MSSQLSTLIGEILYKNFGELVEKVGSDLFSYGAKPIGLIMKTTKLPKSQVVECLQALIKFDLVSFEPSVIESIADYKLITDNVLLMLRYPRFLLQIKNKNGSEAELIIEEILQNGIITATEVIYIIAKKYKDDEEKNTNIMSLRDIYLSLSTAGYIKRMPKLAETNSDVPTYETLILDEIPANSLDLDFQGLTKSLNSDEGFSSSDATYWKVNFDRFNLDLRDELMINAISRRIDENAGELLRHMLTFVYISNDTWSETSHPIASIDIKNSCKRAIVEFPLLVQYLDQYLKVIEDNSEGMVSRRGDASGGHYVVDMKKSAIRLTMDVIDHLVQEKLGSNAARIFRLVRSHRYIEEANIQKHAMLPAKEAKKLTYKLMEEHFITVQPLRKAAGGGMVMTKAVYLYHVDIHQTACMVRELCYASLWRCAKRMRSERALRERLLQKQQRVESILHGMRLRGEPLQNIIDIEETITPPERSILENVGKMFKKLDIAELELDKMLFILQWYFAYT